MSSFTAPKIMPNVSAIADDLNTASTTFINDAIDQLGNSITDFAGEIGNLFDDITEVFDVGLTGFIQNLIESTGGSNRAFIDNLVDVPLSDQQFSSVMSDLEVGDVKSASVTMAENSTTVTAAQYESILSLIDVTVSGQIVFDASNTVFPKTYDIGSNQYQWSGAASEGFEFTYISSIEELQAEMRSIKREVTEVVVHWSDSFTNKHLTAQQIHDAQIAVGINGIGYHYVIRRDGTLQRARPVDKPGEHSSNHDDKSVAVCFVGGYNCPTGTEDPTQFLSSASLTREQMTTFDRFIDTWYAYYPGGQVIGHNDIETTEIDPGFDVIDYCRTRFNKVSLYTDPSQELPFTPEQINNSLTPEQASNLQTLTVQNN